MKQVFSDNRIVILIGIVGFTGGIWGIHTHAFEGDDLAYLQGSSFGASSRFGVLRACHSLFAESPAGYHLVLVGLHLIATITVGLCVFRFTDNPSLAVLSSCLFLINVSHYRVVTL